MIGPIKRLAVLGIFAASLFSVTACERLDVIGNGSITSFDSVLSAVPNQIEIDESNAGWSLAAPDGSARFIWSGDWSQSPLYDVMLELDARPFIDAGLNPKKLSGNYLYNDGIIIIGAQLGDNAPNYDSALTPLSAYEQIVKTRRDSIGYHMSLDHYGVNLGGGNMFEWAKDMSINDKDIVFVLNPEPLIAAGADPESVAGWVFAKVETMDEGGKMVEADKFLKPFDLK